jgi:hypothetical protein
MDTIVKDGGSASLAIKKARHINDALKEQDVYNYICLSINGDNRMLTNWQSLQHSLRLAEEGGNLRHEARITADGDVTAVFITAESCIQICRSYPFLMQMDRTFNIIKVKDISFLNITVEDCCGRQRIVAFVLMVDQHTKEEDYDWIFQRVTTILLSDTGPRPHSVGIDHELALYNALQRSNLCSYVYFCTKHMTAAIKAALARALPSAAENDLADDILGRIVGIMKANSTDLLALRKADLAATPFAAAHPAFMIYLNTTWYPDERCWADAYRNQHRHYGWSTTNGVEGSHASIKRYLHWEPKSSRDFVNRLDDIFNRQEINFRQSMAKQSATPSWITKGTGNLFSRVIRVASHHALKLIYEQFKRYKLFDNTNYFIILYSNTGTCM